MKFYGNEKAFFSLEGIYFKGIAIVPFYIIITVRNYLYTSHHRYSRSSTDLVLTPRYFP